MAVVAVGLIRETGLIMLFMNQKIIGLHGIQNQKQLVPELKRLMYKHIIRRENKINNHYPYKIGGGIANPIPKRAGDQND